MTKQPSESVIILGRSVSGLAAARDLAKRGYAVTLLDYAPWEPHPPLPDTLLGCHTKSLALLTSLSEKRPLTPDDILPLEFLLPTGIIVSYRPTTLPGSLHWIAGLLRFRGLSWPDRWALLSYLERVWEQEDSIPTVLESDTAETWLKGLGQSQVARDTIWSPLARFLTGTPLAELPAATFAQAATHPFLRSATGARITQLKAPLTERLVASLASAALESGARIVSLEAPPQLRFEQHAITQIRLRDGSHLQAAWYLSALSHKALCSLLPERLLTRYAYFSHISELHNHDRVTVDCYGPAVGKSPRFILLSGTTATCLSLKPSGPDAAHYRLTYQGEGLADRSDRELATVALHDLGVVFPALSSQTFTGPAIDRHAQVELTLKAGTTMARPIHHGPIKNFLLAGGWTDTGWPDNLESAVVSATRCVDHITGTGH